MGSGGLSFSLGKGPSKGAAPAKLAFGLKAKAKPGIVGIFGDVEDDGGGSKSKKQRTEGHTSGAGQATTEDGGPPEPRDIEVKKVVDKLAVFVAKHGRQLENVTRQRNPGDTPFRFLFDDQCDEYKYYEWRVGVAVKALNKESGKEEDGGKPSAPAGKEKQKLPAPSLPRSGPTPAALRTAPPAPPPAPIRYTTSAAALYGDVPVEPSVKRRSFSEAPATEAAGPLPPPPAPPEPSTAAPGPAAPPDATGSANHDSRRDSLSQMDFFMQKAARLSMLRPKKDDDENSDPDTSTGSAQQKSKRGHHMGDFASAAAERGPEEGGRGGGGEPERLQADNKGHRMLQKMGWKEGQGLGHGGSGIAEPVRAGGPKQDHLGIGAGLPDEPEDPTDIFEQYKRRMMQGYKNRPNPLGNPRRPYY